MIGCRELDAPAAKRLLKKAERLHGPRRLAARLHVAMHRTDQASPDDWATTQALVAVAEMERQFWRDALTYALAVVHIKQRDLPGPASAFKFRCSLIAAQELSRVNLRLFAFGSLAPAIGIANQVATSGSSLCAPGPQNRDTSELHWMLDGCLHAAAYFDAILGERAREWLVTLGQVLSQYARTAATADPQQALLHSVAFKGALTTELLVKPGPSAEDDSLRQSRHQIAALERAEGAQSLESEAPDELERELRRCAWLHTGEQLSGVTVSERKRNAQSRFDEVLLSSLAVQRMPLGIAESDVHPGRLADQLGERGVLVDFFLGRGNDGAYITYATVLSQHHASPHVVRQMLDDIVPRSGPQEQNRRLAIDALGQLIASVRYEMLEPAGPRPVSRNGAAALNAAARCVLGELAGHLEDLRAEGCDQLIVWPHGPLAFVPFHLLPIGEATLADHWTVITVPSLNALMVPPARDRTAEVSLGIIASPDGGVEFDLPSEPRLWDQAMDLHNLVPDGVLLGRGDATPAAAVALLSRSRYVHIGAHGSALEQVPSYHCLFLDESATGDGRLFAHEVLQADLRTVELVTLCACETALGRVDPAGNIRGLPTALMAAGAQAVIATLWPVAAEPALEFFTELYAQLDERRSPIDAFRGSQMKTRERFPRYAHWGAFTYVGSWR